MTRRLLAWLGAIVAILLVPGVALAHPLGNFTVNHYAGIRVTPLGVQLDVVIDRAEIPTFQIRRDLDADGDGELTSVELDMLRSTGCVDVLGGLALTAGGSALNLHLTAAGVSFPPGNGGLSTMRLVCQFEAPFAGPITGPTEVMYADRFLDERIGWREIVVTTDGTTASGALQPGDDSSRLTSYPADQLAVPRDDRSVTFTVTPGGPAAAPFVAPDAQPIGDAPAPSPAAPTGAPPTPDLGPRTGTAAVPGGADGIPAILLAGSLDPLLIVVALATAALLGAGHALTPGHGKTLMAAYLVGTRGTPLHAAGLGLSVSVSHTLGILALALVVVGAQQALPPDLVVRAAPVIAAITILAIGAWMVTTEIRRARRSRAEVGMHAHDHREPHEPAGSHGHDHDHDAHEHGAHGHDHRHQHPAADALEHSHGGIRHRHAPAPGATISWRSLFVLGLAGGLVPSTNALLILLGTIAAGRPVWGVALVVAFGLGMALVMTSVGLAFVYARGFLERMPARSGAGRVARLMPLGAAVLVLGIGLVLTGQAIGGATVL